MNWMSAPRIAEVNRLYRCVNAVVSLVAWQLGGAGDEPLAHELIHNCIPDTSWQAHDYSRAYEKLADTSSRVRAAYPLDGHILADGLLVARDYIRHMAIVATKSDPSEGSAA